MKERCKRENGDVWENKLIARDKKLKGKKYIVSKYKGKKIKEYKKIL